ncbi:hypothetical protein C0J56_08285 [Pseudomonas fluorescens]|nr:hypothetical protein C0J56_08285 [Pseudomonas fluorescens]
MRSTTTPDPALQILWERACSRMRFNIQHLCWLSDRIREQARSHTLIGVSPINRRLFPPTLLA